MAETQHFSELQLLALLDEELPRPEAAAARSHLTRCFPCHRLYEGLRRESDVLRAAAAPETASRPEVSHELGWVVAAGLVLSLGLVAFRRAFLGMGKRRLRRRCRTPFPCSRISVSAFSPCWTSSSSDFRLPTEASSS